MKGRRPDDPTPEEIAERAAEIRAEWCDEVRAQRETVRQRKDWRPPVHAMPQPMKSLGFN